MAEELTDFYQGETKNWSAAFDSDITGCTVSFRMAKDLKQAISDLNIIGEALLPVNGEILGVTFALTPAQSAALEPGEYYAEHEIRSATRVELFLRQKITVKHPVPGPV